MSFSLLSPPQERFPDSDGSGFWIGDSLPEASDPMNTTNDLQTGGAAAFKCPITDLKIVEVVIVNCGQGGEGDQIEAQAVPVGGPLVFFQIVETALTSC